MKEIHFSKKDFRIDWFSGTGAGGQYRNKHQNCCRITHLETKLVATGQSHRERPANQAEAFNALVRKLLAWFDSPVEERRASNEIVRTYRPDEGPEIDMHDAILERKSFIDLGKPRRYTGR